MKMHYLKFTKCFTTILLPFAMAGVATGATLIDIAGSVDGTGPDEFANYSSLMQSDPITPISTVTDGDYTLAVDGFGDQSGAELVGWGDNHNGGTAYNVGQEINFQKGGDATDAAGAISQDMYLELSLSTTGTAFNWESISVTLWRNGGAAAADYQFAYSSDATWDASDLLGSVTNVSGSGATAGGVPNELATITFDASNIVTNATDETVRLYFWGGSNSAWQGNSHLTNVTAEFSVIPEPSTLALAGFGMAGALFFFGRRRRAR